MSESARKKQRLSMESPLRVAPNGTTNSNPTTPFRRAASAGPTPGSRKTPTFRTPGTGRTPRGGPATRPIPSRRVAPTTPHAIRALRERANAARTPGQNRRRSGKLQRETPRDMLRDLSRALARDTRPIEPSPEVLPQRQRHSALDLPDVEDSPNVAAPRLSMALEDMYDEDSFHDAPPRQSLLPDLPDDVDGGTVQSLEFGRRALSEDPRLMYGGRQSERFADFSELGPVEEEFEIDGQYITMRDDRILDEDTANGLDEDTTTQMRVLTGRRNGRSSDVDLGVFGDADDDTEEPTFRFMIPERIRTAPVEPILDAEEETPQQEFFEAPGEQAEDLAGGDDVSAVAGANEEEDERPTETGGMIGWESDDEVADDADLLAYREEESALDRSLQTQSPERRGDATPQQPARRTKEFRVSRRGLEYPSFPATSVKKLALGFMQSGTRKPKLNKETVAALVRASDDFFEQIGDDLAAYAQHGGRKMIEESDVLALMKRTRKTTSNHTSFSLAQKLLPRELLQQLRMEPPVKLKGQKRKRLNTIQEEEE